MKKLSESKLLFCLFFAILFFNLFPYIYQHFNNIPSKVYIGSFPILIDQSSYLAKMAQGQDGHWLIINKFTNELQRPSPVYIFYAFLGQASRFSHISLKSTLLISRFVFGFLLILTIIFFLRYFIKEKEQRIFAYLLVFFGSGLGWLGLTQNSLDLWMPDFMPMVRFSYFPHMPLATALFILTVMAMHKSFQENKKLLAIAAGGATFILNIILPFHSLLLYWVLCLYALAVFVKNPPCRRIYLKNFFIFFSFSIISFLYMFYIKETNPIWKIVEQQNILGSPSVYAIFLGFGISSLLSVAGLYLMYLKKQQTAFLFIIWPVSALTLAFLPMSIMPIQRRFLETGLFVPLAVPVSYVLFQLYQFLQNKHLIFLNKSISYTFLIYILLAFIIFPGNLTNALQFKKLIIQGSNNPFVYISLPMYKGIQWLEKNTPATSVILSSFYNGNLIPYLAKRIVYVGHGPETIYLNEKMIKVNNFYSGGYTNQEALDFLKKERIDFVFYSEYEKKYPNFNPDPLNFLKKVFDNEGVQIYQVIK